MLDHQFYDAAALDTAGAYRFLVGAVVPRPIAWITSVGASGLVNAAPFSSYNYVCHSPPMLGVNIGTREGALKDTARNVVESREFVVNVVTEAQLDLMHASAADHPADASEAELLGIELAPSRLVRAPRIAASPIAMECRLEHVLPLGNGFSTLYIGQVIGFHVSPAIFDGRRVDSVKMRPVCRLGGPYYAALGEIFYRPMLSATPDKG